MIKLENGKTEEATTRSDGLLEKHPHYPTVQYAKGCLCAQQGDPAASIPFFEDAVRINPYFLEAWANLSLAASQVLKLSRAAEAAREVIELDQPGSPISAQAKSLLTDLNRFAREGGVSLKNFLEASVVFDEAFDLMDQGDFEGARKGF